jgi:hypothetical protein
MFIVIEWVMSPIIQFGVVFLLIFWYLSRKQKGFWVKNLGMALVVAFGVTFVIQALFIGLLMFMHGGTPTPVDF